MKYIKSHKLFESNTWIRDELKDLLANLEDEGYKIRISYMGSNNGFVTILPKDMKLVIEIDDIADDVYRMNEYLKDRYICDYIYKPAFIHTTKNIAVNMSRGYVNVSIDDIKNRKSNSPTAYTYSWLAPSMRVTRFALTFRINIYTKDPIPTPAF